MPRRQDDFDDDWLSDPGRVLRSVVDQATADEPEPRLGSPYVVQYQNGTTVRIGPQHVPHSGVDPAMLRALEQANWLVGGPNPVPHSGTVSPSPLPDRSRPRPRPRRLGHEDRVLRIGVHAIAFRPGYEVPMTRGARIQVLSLGKALLRSPAPRRVRGRLLHDWTDPKYFNGYTGQTVQEVRRRKGDTVSFDYDFVTPVRAAAREHVNGIVVMRRLPFTPVFDDEYVSDRGYLRRNRPWEDDDE